MKNFNRCLWDTFCLKFYRNKNFGLNFTRIRQGTGVECENLASLEDVMCTTYSHGGKTDDIMCLIKLSYHILVCDKAVHSS